MKTWHVLAFGEGFNRQGSKMGFELSGFINAADPDAAFAKAVSIAKVDFPELGQADALEYPKPVINAEEIQEASETRNTETDSIEIYWYVE